MHILSYIKRHSVVAVTVAVVAVGTMVVAGRVASRAAVSDTASSTPRQVSFVDASLFRKDVSTVSADGVVESVSQADLKSQMSAPVAAIYASVGDTVSAGQTIVELQNADIRAQLDQARASLALAEGQYDTGSASVDSARKSAIDKVHDAYVAADDAIRGQLDQFLFNSAGGDSPLSSRISDLKLLDRIHTERTDLDGLLDAWKKTDANLSSATSSDSSLFAALDQSKDALSKAGGLFDDVSSALNEAVKNASASTVGTLNGWKSIVTAAKASLNGQSTAVTATEASLRTTLSSHGTPAEASISAATAGVKGLEAALAKTIIVSPISGKVAALPLRVGELATPGTLIATVVGGQGLQVKAYASGEDLDRLQRGATALIKGTIAGTVSTVAPSVSSLNKKVEVVITVDSAARSGLVIGQSVPVSIRAAAPSQATASASRSYFLPIQDVKIVPGAAYVFTLDGESKAVRHDVTLGTVSGDFVEIASGITDDMKLVSPVYEIEEGQTVDAR